MDCDDRKRTPADHHLHLRKQIAGLIARRILGFVSEKQFLEQGERYGLIRFGSRVDIYMPLDATVTCAVGDKVVAGKSKLAKLNNTHE